MSAKLTGGSPAPGTQPEHMQHIEDACRRVLEPGGIDVAWFLAEGARQRAERAAGAAASPSPPPAYDPVLGPVLCPVRAYMETVAGMDAYLTQFANAARQRNAARAQPVLAAGATEEPALVGLPPVIVRPSDHGAERAPPGYVLVAASALAGATATEGSAALVAATGALGPIAAAVAAGAAVYLAYKQYRSLVDQGVLPPVTMGQDNIEGYDPLGHPILKVLPPGYGEGPRVLAPLSGLTPAAPVPGTRTGEGGFTPAPKLDKPGQDGFTPAPLRPQIMNSWGDGAPTTVDQGHQDKHIQGTNNYDPTRSRSALTAKPQQLLDTYSGKGQPVKDVPRGQQGFREVFDTQGMVIGSFHDLGTGADLPTTRGTIHYSKGGAHIVPARPNFSGKNQHD